MWFPNRRQPKKSTIDGAIERYRRARGMRRLAGLCIDRDFQQFSGSLVTFRGSGKWMRPEHHQFTTVDLSAALRQACQSACKNEFPLTEAMGVGFDLGDAAADALEQLLGVAKLSVDDLLAVAIDEPGIVWREFDGRRGYVPFLQPQRVSERTGLNVIDSFSAADIAGGGNGLALEPLAYWLMLADRSASVSETIRILVVLTDDLKVYRLPPSDGLEAELPDLAIRFAPGLRMLRDLAAPDSLGCPEVQSDSESPNRSKSPNAGATIAEWLSKQWQPPSFSRFEREEPVADQWYESFTEGNRELADDTQCSHSDMVDSIKRWMVELTGDLIQGISKEEQGPIEIIVATNDKEAWFQPALEAKVESNSISTIDVAGYSFDSLFADTSAVLGMMHIDQLPASIPWITGCAVPRMHGRVTPGRPAHWRRLLIEMADYHPPAMKLRDAI